MSVYPNNMGVAARPPSSPAGGEWAGGRGDNAAYRADATVIHCSGISHLSSFSHFLSVSRSLPTHICIVSISVNSKKSVSAENDVLGLTLIRILHSH